MKEKEIYSSPNVTVAYVSTDIITYSEDVELALPPIQAGHEDDQQ